MATEMPNPQVTETATGENTQATEPKKPTFDAEQQAFINGIIAREKSQLQDKTSRDMETMRSQVHTLQSELTDAKQALDSRSKNGDNPQEAKTKVEELQAQVDEIKRAASIREEEARKFKELAKRNEKDADKAREEVTNLRRSNAIQNAASKQNFFNLEAVQMLTEKFVKYDKDNTRFVVTNESGQERLNASFEPMTLDEFYDEFAVKNKYLVRGDVKPGLNSSESVRSGLGAGRLTVEQIFGPKSNSKMAQDLAKQDIKEYRRLKEIAKQQNLIV